MIRSSKSNEMEGGRWDMLEWLGPDASICVINYLDDPADVVRAAAVSQSWRNFVISNEFGKMMCMKLCPEISNFTHIELPNRDILCPLQEASSSTSMEWQIQERAHIVYTYCAHRILIGHSDKDCVMSSIGASSTDNFPEEGIENTLEPYYSVDLGPSYWSSAGQADPNVQESLVYRLESDLYFVNEIRIRPFKALFQDGHPIYSAKHVRFRMGHSKFNLSELSLVTAEEESQLTKDDNYVWTYISPEYSMAQESNLQAFKLPRPILCIGGVLKIELLGRVQKQEADDLYYICVGYVQVIGCPLSLHLIVDRSTNYRVLKYYLQTNMTCATAASSEVQSRQQIFSDRIQQMGPDIILRTIFGGAHLQFDDDDDDDENDIDVIDGDSDDGDAGDHDDDVHAPH
ncbi:hypothetical protein LUZ63_011474 [Rhynchospora breviuscula]|uniref:F-box domain-containing protein n=1 Tax=Rhynchospora breviuscula TaxID=2022672 RepID=A0A9Q0CIT9_9POAL|nr:hypothetical protein LUZ63_011474 [Rhynchospora breviuscula]